MKRRYGLDWDENIPEHQIDLILWKKFRERPYSRAQLLNPISEHFLRACRALFTPEQLVIHPWFETMAWSYTMHRRSAFLGAASSGKSHFVGIAFLLDYLADPANTYCCLVSTTKEMLLLRSFASCVEYLGYLRSNGLFHCPFKYVAQKTAIVPESIGEGEIGSYKAMIKGVAIREGSSEDAKASIMGVHLPYVRTAADEYENMSDRARAFEEAQSNLEVCRDYKCLYCFNPQGIYMPGSALCAPESGWGSLDPDTSLSLDAQAGLHVERFDGHRSPALQNPEKFTFLPSEKTLKDILVRNHGNPDSPSYWSMARAFPPPHSTERTVFTEQMVKSYNMMDTVVWKSDFKKAGALDPAFTSGGDGCVLVTAKIGLTRDGLMAICFDKLFYLKILASDKRPVLEQIQEQAVALMDSEDIRIENFGCDDSGTQSVADAIAMKRGGNIYRSNFASKPPELPVSVSNDMMADKKYRNHATWMYYTAAEYAQRGQIKGLFPMAADQFCKRRVLEKQLPLQIESKKDFKKRAKRSPDEADACAILIALCRERLGLMPGATEFEPAGDQTPFVPTEDPWYVRKLNNLRSDYSGGSI